MSGFEKTGYEQFLEAPSRRRLLEQESLILEAAELLSVLMDNEEMSRSDLAARLGRSRAYITQALQGTSNLTLRTLADIAAALGYRFRFQAQDMTSGGWVSLSDVPHLYVTRQENLLACWRGFGQAAKHRLEPEQFQEQEHEILPLSA